MIARHGSGWQTVLADLTLILFMVSVGALAHSAPIAPKAAQPAPGPVLVQGEPVAVWRPGNAGQDLAQWLAAQQDDPRARLTLIIHAPPERAADAVARARAAGGPAADGARIVIEPGTGPDLEAVLAYDRLPSARDLQSAAGVSSDKELK